MSIENKLRLNAHNSNKKSFARQLSSVYLTSPKIFDSIYLKGCNKIQGKQHPTFKKQYHPHFG